MAYATGMAAIRAALAGRGGQEPGASVVAAADVYGATYALLERTLAELGVRTVFRGHRRPGRRAARGGSPSGPAAVLCEAVSNPLIKVADIPALVRVAHDAGAALLVDGSFVSTLPAAARWRRGADYSIHSATKYLGGHGDRDGRG